MTGDSTPPEQKNTSEPSQQDDQTQAEAAQKQSGTQTAAPPVPINPGNKKAPTLPAPTLNPSGSIVVGTPVLLAVAVSGGDAAPTGTATFQYSTDGGSTWTDINKPVTLTTGSGSASSASTSFTPSIATGYKFQVVYSGDNVYANATSALASLTVNAGVSLTVFSGHGNPQPGVGKKLYNKATQIDCSVDSPVREGLQVWQCEGWVGTGSVPNMCMEPADKTADATSRSSSVPCFKSKTVSFPLDEDSQISWKWKSVTIWQALSDTSSWQNQVISIGILIVVFGFSLYNFYDLKHAFFLAIFAGALGGLIHEFAQSYGKFLLPTTDEKGNQCLGILIGALAGGIAGLFVYQELFPHAAVGPTLALTTLISGLAAKGLADAPTIPATKKS